MKRKRGRKRRNEKEKMEKEMEEEWSKVEKIEDAEKGIS